jgi:methylase of polypeptide subunit release factors
MHPVLRQSVLDHRHPELGRIREMLAAANYTDRGIIEKLGSVEVPTGRTRNLPRLLRFTGGGARLDTLIRLFLFGIPVDEADAREACDPVTIEALRETGLIEWRDGKVSATCLLFPYGRMAFAFDHPNKMVAGAPPDVVMGVTASTMDLARATVRRPVRNVLDLGTGCGLQAMLASPHAGRVCAVDTNPRAIDFARFNMALNGIANVECREGSLFEPVRGERFDLIVGNLPFVIAPSGRYTYRDGGMELDSFARSVVRQAPAYLEEDGFCQLLCEWVHIRGEDWQQRLSGWFEGTGCDSFVLTCSTSGPLAYAESWIRDTEKDDPDLFARLYDEWTAYYDDHNVEAITTGLIFMRRAGGRRNWFHIDELPAGTSANFGEAVAGGFAACDYLQATGAGRALLEEKLRLSPDARLTTEMECGASGWTVKSAQLRLVSGLPYNGNVDTRVANLLARANGERRLGELLSETAAALHTDVERVVEACLPLVRQLVERGFLAPVKP